MEVVSHVAKEHHQEEKEEAWNVEFQSIPKQEVHHVKKIGIKDNV